MTEKEQKEIFAHNLNRYIEQSGKDQKEVAIEIGFEPTTFNTWCMGKIIPSAPKLRQIADYFNIGVSFLLDVEPDERILRYYSKDQDITPRQRFLLNQYEKAEERTKMAIDVMLGMDRFEKEKALEA